MRDILARSHNASAFLVVRDINFDVFITSQENLIIMYGVRGIYSGVAR